jgi:hypothetical protein
VTALKVYRHDLAAHIAAELDITAPKLGAQINPPAVIVQSGTPYIEASGYCDDAILLDAVLITTPGDPPAVADALDDFIDLIRPALREPSPANHRYGFRSVSGLIEFPVGEATLPAVIVTVAIERRAP